MHHILPELLGFLPFQIGQLRLLDQVIVGAIQCGDALQNPGPLLLGGLKKLKLLVGGCFELIPERFGRKREYALGKNSGRANIAKNLEELGLELTPEQTKRVTKRITELGDRKEIVTPDDLPYIVSDVLKHDAPEDKVKLVSYMTSIAYGLKPLANVKVDINGKQFEANSTGDGQYDAFVKALRKIYKENLGRTFPILSNYSVTIPPGGRTDALVQTVITWRNGEKIIRTRGLDADQTEAAIKATFKMLNIFEESENAQKGVI